MQPGATEIVGDEVDQDCNGQEVCYRDSDNDGYRLTATVSSSDVDCADSGEARVSEPSGDCNDADAAIYPGAPDPPGDGTDSDCDGADG
jgi:hypothetical protein